MRWLQERFPIDDGEPTSTSKARQNGCERLGKATASRMADIVAKTRTGLGASRANFPAELVAERLTGFPQDAYINAAMQWGLDREAEAKEVYAARISEPVPMSALCRTRLFPCQARARMLWWASMV